MKRLLTVWMMIVVSVITITMSTGLASVPEFVINNGVLVKYNGKGGKVVIPEGVTSISSEVFLGCRNLTSLILPDSLTSIGANVCYKCENLKSIVFPEKLISIGDNAFSHTGIAEITIPASVTSIGFSFRAGKMKKIFVDSRNSKYCDIDGVLFNKSATELIIYPYSRSDKTYTIPDGVLTICDGAFYCPYLTSISIPDSVTSLSGYSFYCEKLQEILVDDLNGQYSVIDGVLFNKSATEIVLYPRVIKNSSYTIPESIASIGKYAFRGCNKLKNITLPKHLTNIGIFAFEGCKGLCSIALPDGITEIGVGIFYECSGLKSIYIPNSVESIGECSFAFCTSLKNIDIPESVKAIDRFAFESCSSLTNVTLSSQLKTIGDYAFTECKKLKAIRIPPSVKSIGESAFKNTITLNVDKDTYSNNYAIQNGYKYKIVSN